MKILFLTDNFPPEGNAPASRTFEHAVHWVQQGHQVTVITGAPNFPEGKVFDGYSNRAYFVEQMEGIRVVRVKTYIVSNAGFLKRTLDYMSFMGAGFLAGLIQERPDIVIATSPQFFTACAGWALSATRRVPFIFELRDLWPASIIGVGAMKDGFVVRGLENLELFLYRRADQVVAVTRAFREDLVQRGIDREKISVIVNGVNRDLYQEASGKDEQLCQEHDLEGKFVVGYIGTHGMAHGLSSVLAAAELCKDDDQAVFLFVGAGPARDALVEEARAKGLNNVRFVSRQPKEMMPRYWSLCDVALIHLRNLPLFQTVIPSKLFEAMGMGLPVLLALPQGEAAEIVQETGCGVVVQPEDPEALCRKVAQLRDDPRLLGELKRAGLAGVEQYSRQKKAQEMLEVIEAVEAGKTD